MQIAALVAHDKNASMFSKYINMNNQGLSLADIFMEKLSCE